MNYKIQIDYCYKSDVEYYCYSGIGQSKAIFKKVLRFMMTVVGCFLGCIAQLPSSQNIDYRSLKVIKDHSGNNVKRTFYQQYMKMLNMKYNKAVFLRYC